MASLNNHEERIKAIENGLMSVSKFTKTLSVTAGEWIDTGIKLDTGTYIVKIEVHTASYGSSIWHETYSGICSSFNSGTNSTVVTEIPLTSAGHATNELFITFGFRRYPNTESQKTCFVISSNGNFVDCPITFIFRKVL